MLMQKLGKLIYNQGLNISYLLKGLFDHIIFTGSSVGALLASTLYSLVIKNSDFNELDRILNFEITKIFSKRSWGLGIYGKYSSSHLKNFIDQHICEEYNDSISLIIPCYNITDEKIEYSCLTKNDNISRSLIDTSILSIKEQILASCSAPSYFKPVQHYNIMHNKDYYYVDGGVTLNNPTAFIISAIIGNVSFDNLSVLSLGYNKSLKQIRYDNILDIIKLMIKAATDSRIDHEIIKNLTKRFKQIKYMRKECIFSKDRQPDDLSKIVFDESDIQSNNHLMDVYDFLIAE